MYNPKFQYTKLSREEVNGRRLYATPDGNNVPSVTTILDRTKSEEKKQILENWRRRVGHAQAQVITTEAANRGTRMHTYLEGFVKEGELKDRGSNPFSWPSHAMAQVVKTMATRRSPLPWGIAFGVTMSMVALAIHSTVDFNLQIPSNALTMVVILSMGWVARVMPHSR